MVSFSMFASATLMLVASTQQAFAAELRGSEQGRELGVPFWCKWYPSLCNQCPEVSPLQDLDLDRYIEKTWYVQKQQINPYQSEDQLYCVTATYSLQNNSKYLKVENYANNGEVNGPVQGGSGLFSDLCANQKEEGTGELAVAPCVFSKNDFVFDLVAGPYWVIAMDEVDYSWAIISGGQPNIVKEKDPVLCTTKEGTSFLDTNGSGLWLFTREPIASNETIKMMEDTLVYMGVYPDDLKPVDQKGCLYEGANIKD